MKTSGNLVRPKSIPHLQFLIDTSHWKKKSKFSKQKFQLCINPWSFSKVERYRNSYLMYCHRQVKCTDLKLYCRSIEKIFSRLSTKACVTNWWTSQSLLYFDLLWKFKVIHMHFTHSLHHKINWISNVFINLCSSEIIHYHFL